jgi:hypothetical protein
MRRMAAKTAETTAKPDWSPPSVDEQGHELFGDFPLSGPARALAIAKAGRKTDPDGLLSPEQIAAISAGVPKPEPATDEGSEG